MYLERPLWQLRRTGTPPGDHRSYNFNLSLFGANLVPGRASELVQSTYDWVGLPEGWERPSGPKWGGPPPLINPRISKSARF